MVNFFKSWIAKHQMTQMERYLSQSVDRADLERREKQLKYTGFYI